MADDQGIMKEIRLFTTHNGAANMVKSSQLLKAEQFTHCIAHARHLLLVTDGLNKVPELKELLDKCSTIVTKLHFKECELEDEDVSLEDEDEKKQDSLALNTIMQKIEEVAAVAFGDADDPICDNDELQFQSQSGDISGKEPVQEIRIHKHRTLKKPVVTWWSSALHMIESILDNIDAIDQVLLTSGLGDLRLEKVEKVLLAELQNFLKPFEENTQLVSSSGAFLSLMLLIQHDIKQRSSKAAGNCHPAMLQLKQHISINVNR